MSFRRRTEYGHEAGFSMIELMIVVLIIGLISSIAIPMMRHAMDKAHRATVAESGRAIYTGLIQHNVDTGTFPVKVDLQTLEPLSTLGYVDNAESIVAKLYAGRMLVYIPLGTEEFFVVLRSKTNPPAFFTVMRTDNWGGDPGVWFDGVYYYDPIENELVRVDEAT
jgi:prepilin-type N-terminal cleavage/methylation domain-containing protein